MIDFSSYTEQPEFLIPNLDITKPGQRFSDFKEAFFERKRELYVEYLKDNEQALLNIVTQVLNHNPSTSPQDPNSINIQNMIHVLNIGGFSSRFRWTNTIISGADYAYDFYRELLNYGSRVSGLKTYDELYVTMFDKVYTTADQIFNRIGTRGQLMGYIELFIIEAGQFMNTLLDDLNNSTSWLNAWTILTNSTQAFDTMYQNFITEVNAAFEDIRLLVEPIVKYINLIDLGSSILTDAWGSYGIPAELRITIDKYNKEAVSFNEDYHIHSSGITSQILEQLRTSILPDRSNFELIITKATKLAFIQNDIHNLLTLTNTELLNPGY